MRAPHLAVRLLAIAVASQCTYWSNPSQALAVDPFYHSALESITPEDLWDHVEYLADDRLEGREAGTEGGRLAMEYLCAQLEELNIRSVDADGGFVQSFASDFRNVLGILEGTDPELKNQAVIICAHYDHVGYGTEENSQGPIGQIHNGADDNASGTSALLELAEAFCQLTTPPRRSILFAFWDAEEAGLLGSRHWVAHPTLPLKQVVAAVNFDMIGRLRDNRLIVYGSRTAYGFRRLVSRHNRTGLSGHAKMASAVGQEGIDGGVRETQPPMVRLSKWHMEKRKVVSEQPLRLDFSWELEDDADHYPLFRCGVPVLFLHTGLHDEFHSPRDDAHLVDPQGMTRITRLAFRIAYDLAQLSETPRFRPAAAKETETLRGEWADYKPRLPDRLGAIWQPPRISDQKVRVSRIVSRSPAAKAYLRPGDRILRFAGHAIHTQEDLTSAVLLAPHNVPIVVRRQDRKAPLNLSVRLDGNPLRLGITWRMDDAEPGTAILTCVVAHSPAGDAGLRVGDRIYQVAGQNFTDNRGLIQLIRTATDNLQLLVERDGQLRSVSIRFYAEPGRRAV